MAKIQKLMSRMRSNPRDWRIEDLQVIADHYGVTYDQHGTSHCTFRHPSAGRLPVPAARPIHSEYVKLFVKFMDKVVCDE
jgi:hypothetical protein